MHLCTLYRYTSKTLGTTNQLDRITDSILLLILVEVYIKRWALILIYLETLRSFCSKISINRETTSQSTCWKIKVCCSSTETVGGYRLTSYLLIIGIFQNHIEGLSVCSLRLIVLLGVLISNDRCVHRLPRTIDSSIREDLSYHLVIVHLVVIIRPLQLSFFKGFILIRKNIDVRGSSFRVKDDLSILVRNQFLDDRRFIIIIWIGSLNRYICYWLPILNIDNNIPCFLLWL